MNPRQKLISLLDSLAAYNDKGFAWSGHTPEKADEERATARAEIAGLFEQIGERELSAELLEGFRSGVLLTDWSGKYVEEARKSPGFW